MGSAFFAKKKNCPFLKYLHKNHDTTKMVVIANDNFLNNPCYSEAEQGPSSLDCWDMYSNDFLCSFSSCPFDAVTIYDGPDNMAEKIGTYCGQMRNLVIFSTQNKLFITFTTLKRTAPAQNRGFIAIYEFAESYIKLDFIQPDAEHIRGTECDQKILSKKESKGEVYR